MWTKSQVVSLALGLLLIIIDVSDESHSHSRSEEVSSELALRSDESCTLPEGWAGNWFQSGFHSIISINQSVINIKGQCVENDRHMFVFYKREDKCFRCVVLHEKHANVLQYKESYCSRTRSPLSAMCGAIHGDNQLYSMFRLNAQPIDCPFRGPFTFTYNRGHGECRSPVSIMDTCTQPSRVLLDYQACPDVPRTESRAEELQCIAAWKDGGIRYLLGLMQYKHRAIANFEDRFRCFAYERVGKFANLGQRTNESSEILAYHVSQSGDATCIGITPGDGANVLKLRQAPTSKPPCQFPNWVQSHAQWESLDQSTRYVFDNSVLSVSNFSQITGNTLTRRGTCMQILHNSSTTGVTLVLHSTSECEIGYVCMTAFRRNGHIMEVQFGNISRKIESACQSPYYDPESAELITLTSPSPESQECPQFGMFDMSGGFSTIIQEDVPCVTPTESTFAAGCTSFDTFRLQTRCSKPDTYLCHGWWEEPNGEEYLVATSTTGDTSQRFCFAFEEILPESSSELKIKKSARKFEDYDENSLGSAERLTHKKTFRFSRFSETCQRHITPGKHGELTFNVTLRDSCAQASTGSSSSSSLKETHNFDSIILNSFFASSLIIMKFSEFSIILL